MGFPMAPLRYVRQSSLRGERAACQPEELESQPISRTGKRLHEGRRKYPKELREKVAAATGKIPEIAARFNVSQRMVSHCRKEFGKTRRYRTCRSV